MANLFIETLYSYRRQKKFLLHEFVLMPNHLHVILTPTGITLEHAMQFIKGGYSHRLNSELGKKFEVWQRGFTDRRIRNRSEYDGFREYITHEPSGRWAGQPARRVSVFVGPPGIQIGSGSGLPQRLKPLAPDTFGTARSRAPPGTGSPSYCCETSGLRRRRLIHASIDSPRKNHHTEARTAQRRRLGTRDC